MLNNRETDSKKSAQYNVKSRHYKWLVLITENLLKNLTNFSSTHVRICVKDATTWSATVLESTACLKYAHFICKHLNLPLCLHHYFLKPREI